MEATDFFPGEIQTANGFWGSQSILKPPLNPHEQLLTLDRRHLLPGKGARFESQGPGALSTESMSSRSAPVIPTPRLPQGLIEAPQKREQAVYMHQALKEYE